jgi:peptidoglycan/xylan/chitin deacetylase (PgdA/CDA1 family)
MMNKKSEIMMQTVMFLAMAIATACNNNNSGTTKNEGGKEENVAVRTEKKVDTVTNKFIHKPANYDSTKKYIYLTFDDGPQNGTVACFNLCKQLNIKATFFMVGLHSERKSDGKAIVHSIKESYPNFLLANHSYSHAYDKYHYFYEHPHMAFEDFERGQQVLSVPYKIIRLPGNSAWVREGELKSTRLVRPVTELLDSAGYNVIGWDVEWEFNHKTANPLQSPQKMANWVDSALAKHHTHTRNHVVILTHDRMFREPNYTDSLAKFITLLKQNPNYVFETVDNYPGLKAGSLKAN